MDFYSKSSFGTLKTIPNGSDNRGTGLLVQAGYIRQEMAGVYIYLPLGLKVLQNIQQIVREELNAIGCQELHMPTLAPKTSWEKTGRWDAVDVLFKLPTATGKECALNPTHEEVVTPLMLEFVRSYKNCPGAVYQFQNKFRNEARAKSGLLRGREFLMKDAYSFHETQEDLDAFFDTVKGAYDKIMDRLGISNKTHYTYASGGDFSKYSYEYQTELEIGEDDVFIDQNGQAYNEEIVDGEQIDKSTCKHITASEVANIFKLGTKFSEPFNMKVTTKEGKTITPVMGCYGIGISRLMGVIAELFADEKGLVWPESIAPYTHYMIVHGDHIESAQKLAKQIENTSGNNVLIDDRDVGFGQKANDADILGIPNRIILSNKTLEKGGYELKSRTSDETSIISL